MIKMRNYDKVAIQVPKILLPRNSINLQKWAVIACDQYTSQPEYWNAVKKFVGNSPSALNIIFPEVYLEDNYKLERIKNIHKEISKYIESNVFDAHEGFVYVERKIKDKIRKGLIVALDLEKYDYSKDSKTLIRATEGTILERLSPRIRIRQNASLELPHIMVLIDDPEKKVIEPLSNKKLNLNLLYDFDLMFNSGHLNGYLITSAIIQQEIINALENLSDSRNFKEKYNLSSDKPVLLYAIGDGNHSLAAAKSIWEELKKKGIKDHPARYVLVELVNLYDPSLEFEPIHRVVFDLRKDILKEMKKVYGDNMIYAKCKDKEELVSIVNKKYKDRQVIGFISENELGAIYIKKPKSNLAVGTLQNFLNSFLMIGGAVKIDYVHGTDTVFDIGSEKGNVGFYLPSMNKNDLFKTVILDGALPRKTFSMGHSDEKRFYVEARKIV